MRQGFDTRSLVNRFRTGQSPCRANLHKCGLAQSPSCDCGQRKTMNYVVDMCPLTKFEYGLDSYGRISVTGMGTSRTGNTSVCQNLNMGDVDDVMSTPRRSIFSTLFARAAAMRSLSAISVASRSYIIITLYLFHGER